MMILGIDTSCDETAVAVTNGQKIISNCVFSQIPLHQQYGGVMPSVAKRAHEEKFPSVLKRALITANLMKNIEDIGIGMKNIDLIAVTTGPGLAIALEVGVKNALSLASTYSIPLIPVNHLWGHLYSCFATNRAGNPPRQFAFPYLGLIVSGGHTELVLWSDHTKYDLLGETLDDACGEALDKIAKYMGLGYPGGPIIERLARVGNENFHSFPLPMPGDNFAFSFSGLKTSFVNFYNSLSANDKISHINDLSASFQAAVIRSLTYKLEKAMQKTGVKNWVIAGGVAANLHLRKKIKHLAKKYDAQVLFPTKSNLCADNAAMIGIAGHHHATFSSSNIMNNAPNLHRDPRWSIDLPFSSL